MLKMHPTGRVEGSLGQEVEEVEIISEVLEMPRSRRLGDPNENQEVRGSQPEILIAKKTASIPMKKIRSHKKMSKK